MTIFLFRDCHAYWQNGKLMIQYSGQFNPHEMYRQEAEPGEYWTDHLEFGPL